MIFTRVMIIVGVSLQTALFPSFVEPRAVVSTARCLQLQFSDVPAWLEDARELLTFRSDRMHVRHRCHVHCLPTCRLCPSAARC